MSKDGVEKHLKTYFLNSLYEGRLGQGSLDSEASFEMLFFVTTHSFCSYIGV